MFESLVTLINNHMSDLDEYSLNRSNWNRDPGSWKRSVYDDEWLDHVDDSDDVMSTGCWFDNVSMLV